MILAYAKTKVQISCAGLCTADQRLCFRLTDSTIPPLLKPKNFQILLFVFGCIGQFVLDLVGNPEDRFFRVEVQLIFNFPSLHQLVLRSVSTKLIYGLSCYKGCEFSSF